MKKSGKLKDTTMDDKFTYIPNDDKQNKSLCRFKLSEDKFIK